MLGGDGGGMIEVGDGAGDLQDAVVRAGRKPHPPHRHFERALAGVVERADLADIADWHAGVVEAAGVLHGAGLFDTGADDGGGFGSGVAAEFLEGDGGDLDMDIDAVEQGTADLAQIVLDLARGTAALAGGIAEKAALVRISVLASNVRARQT